MRDVTPPSRRIARALKEQALAKTNASGGQAVRYKPDDNLLAFLKSL
jgi:hypothetical protein